MFFTPDNPRNLEGKRLQGMLPAIKKVPHAQMLDKLLEVEAPLEEINTMHEFFDCYFQLQIDSHRISLFFDKSQDPLVNELKSMPELAEFIEYHILTLNHYLREQQITSVSEQQVSELFPDTTPQIYTLLNTSPLIKKNEEGAYTFTLYSTEFATYMDAKIDLNLAQDMVNERPI